MEGAVALVLALLSIPFILPLVSWVMARRLRTRVEDLESRLAQQDERIHNLTAQLSRLRSEGVTPAAAAAPAPKAAAVQPPPVLKTPPVMAPEAPKPVAPPVVPPAVVQPPRAAVPP